MEGVSSAGTLQPSVCFPPMLDVSAFTLNLVIDSLVLEDPKQNNAFIMGLQNSITISRLVTA